MSDETEVAERPPVGYTLEGGGTVAACKGCGWEVWKAERRDAETAASGHKKCRAEDVKLKARLERSRGASYQPRRR